MSTGPRSPETKRFRVGALIDGREIPAFEAALLGSIAASDSASLVFAGIDTVADDRDDDGADPLFQAYQWLDRRLLGSSDDALAPVRIDSIAGIPDATVIEGSLEDQLGPDVATLVAADLDVLIDLRRRGRGKAPASVTRHGVWWLRFGPDDTGPALAGDLIRRSAATVSTMVAQLPDADGLVELYRSYTPAVRYSLDRTRQTALWKSANYPVRRLEAMRLDAEADVEPGQTMPTDPGRSSRVKDNGAAPSTVRLLGRVGRDVAGRIAERLLYEHEWSIAYRAGAVDETIPRSLAGFTPIAAPDGRFLADPFIVAVDGVHHVFVEDYDRSRGRAHISTFEIGPEGPRGDPTPILERPYHLSYPFMLEDGGDWFMIPEARSSRRVEAYRTTAFPHAWEPAGVLLDDVSAADPTIVRHDGRLWLFVTQVLRGTNPWDELFLYSAPSMAGPWLPHPKNPVVSDTRSARPAGAPFVQDGHLIRPAQDCSRAYGWRITLNRIDVLTERDYREVPIGRIEPNGLERVTRTHCYNRAGSIEVIDAMRSRTKVPGFG